jgi:hypothetical protein
VARNRASWWPRRFGGRRLSDAQLAAIHAKGQRYTKARNLLSQKPHMTFNPGTGQMEPEDHTPYQRQAPTHVFPHKKSKTGLTKPIEFTPKKLSELRMKAAQHFGESPRVSAAGQLYFKADKERHKKIQRILMARERKIQQKLAKRSGTLRLPEDTNVEIPAGKLRFERTTLPNVGERTVYDPQEVALVKGGSIYPTVTGGRGGSPLKRKKEELPTISGRSIRGIDPNALRFRWKDIISAREKGGVVIRGRLPLKPGLSTSVTGPIKNFRKGKPDPIERIRIQKEKETLRLRKQALRQHVKKIRQNLVKIRQDRRRLEKQIAKRERKRILVAQQTKKKSKIRAFISKITSFGSGNQDRRPYYKELDDPRYRR